MKTESITPAPKVGSSALVRHKRDRWLFAFDLQAEEWNGCHKTLEEAINHALEYREDYYIEQSAPVYMALGAPTPKKECDDMGVEWPWYQVDRATALRIHLPNAGTHRPGTPDGSLATETRKPGSLK